VTEREWLEGVDPVRMLNFLGKRADERKRRLFTAACWREVRDLLTDKWSRKALKVLDHLAEAPRRGDSDQLSEAYSDVESTLATRLWGGPDDQTFLEAVETGTEGTLTRWDGRAARAAAALTSAAAAINEGEILVLNELDDPPDAQEMADRLGAQAAAAGGQAAAAWQEERALQAALLRDLFGNPFRPVRLEAAWLTPAVVSVARAVYEERDLPSGHLDPVRLAVLADALEEVGCDNSELPGHLRQPDQVHVRGCWALDAVLGEE